MSEEQGTFKVTDRRLFNADGTPRELTPEERQPQPTPDATAPTPPTTPPSAQSQSRVEATEQSRQRSADSPSSTAADEVEEFEAGDARNPASFINFVMSIASNAASALGMMEHPVTHQRDVDLELAKHWIDVLGMLHQKTVGNLTSQEQQIIEGLLSDLRMQYVSLTHPTQSKAARPFSGRDIIGGK